jgi:zinc-ribbon domain
MTARARTQNARDLAIGFAILAFLIVGGLSLYWRGEYHCKSKDALTGDCIQEYAADEIPWYAEEPVLNVAVAVPIGAVIGWFIGLSIPVNPVPAQPVQAPLLPTKQPLGPWVCRQCGKQNRSGDRYCEQCGASLV